jgi:hypothetical protein
MAGITKRAARRINVELEDDGYLTYEKTHRRNRYMLSTKATLRHPLEKRERWRSAFCLTCSGWMTNMDQSLSGNRDRAI